MLSGAPNYSQSQIESAVIGMMARSSPGGSFDAAQARTIAQLLGPYVNHPVTGIPSGSVLEGNTEFARMVLEKAPILKAETNDPATRAALTRLGEQQNIAGAPVMSANLAAALGLGIATGRESVSERGGGERAGASSARFDEMGTASGTGTYWSTPMGLSDMRALALSQGLGWAANVPDLLRLGPTAIQALADVKLKQESYEHLTKKFELTPKETVQTAIEAKKRGVDLNGLAETADKIDQYLPPEQRPEFRRGVREFLPRMNDAEAQKSFNAKIDRWKQNNPHLAPEMEKLRKDLKIEQKDSVLQKKSEVKAAAAKVDAFDGLDATEPASSTAPAAAKPKEASETTTTKDRQVAKAENAKPEPPKQKEAGAKPAPAPVPS
jgi:hypothetical protein